ncbi:MAG: gliding motility-associated C-terminal domain-containing protein, partial [Bacteroidales bacterium]|nr:gliding motility-associated C-terminal domain-containing protein [Bacteroidales bacterium]
PILTANITDVTDCQNPNGEIDLHTTGGTVPLNFSIDNGSNFSTDSIFQNISGGYYQTMVVDNHNCSDTLTVLVNSPSTPEIDSVVITDVLCAGDTTGTITIYSSAGAQYSVDNGITFQASNLFTGLTGGNYPIVVESAGGCFSDTNLTVTVNEPAILTLVLTPISPLCSGECNGQMNLSVTGGTAPYGITWSTGNTNTTTLDSLCGGSYSVTITDNNGCQNNSFESIVMPGAINISSYISDVLCNGLNNGYISTIVTGGTSPYQYHWSNGNTTSTDTLLTGGYYSLTVTDINNCQGFLDSIHVKEPDNLLIGISNQQNPYCTGNNDGSITVNATGGTPPYSFVWDNSSTDTIISNLSAGTYIVTVTDFRNCGTNTSIVLSNTNDISVTGQTNIDAQYQGNIDITVTGGDSLDTYTYLWSGNAYIPDEQKTNEDLTGLGAGTFWITVTDVHNCLATDSFTIEIPLIIPTLITPNSDGHNDTWNITNIDSYKTVHIEIFNRWGNVLFTFDGSGLEYKDTDNQWDGTYNTKELPMGSYIYILSLNDDAETYNGVVTIKR